ncbi:uncharacterized protein LOC132204434 isoform X2 [Neocloeon triangulifer]|uniref:uncharacterized protein LOC132204434 isoform X2 n=2 Tax=Neocloeon triangulifer TaxID=2078957 RepID=UPI00286F8451|nr:uncharacterized protein LOC132204434 isoform X2 [Neocloeon triangulifer]
MAVMPLEAKLLLFLFVVAQVHQEIDALNGNKKRSGRRPALSTKVKISKNHVQIIKCCGLKKCLSPGGPSKSHSKLATEINRNYSLIGRTEILKTSREIISTDTELYTENSGLSISSASTDVSDVQISNSNGDEIATDAYSSTSEINELISSTILATVDLATTETSSSATTSTTSASPSTTTATLSETRTTSSVLQTSTQTIKTLDSSESATSLPVTTTTAPVTSTSTTKASTTSTKMTTTTTIDPLLVGKCKAETNAAVNRSLFSTNGALTNPDLHGFWLDACGQTLLLGRSLGTWHQNTDKCLSLNMQPFVFESKEKLECMKLQAKSWRFNMNYWTGGRKDLVSGTTGWCFANGSVSLQVDLPLINSAIDQNCVQMRINKTNGTISIGDRRCSDRLIFACQGPPTKSPKCTSPVCPNFTCQKDPQLFTVSAKDNSSVLKNHTLHGRWFSNKLRHYLFSFPNDTKTYLEATKACCALGMSLLSLDGQHKYDALASIGFSIEMNQEEQNLTLWTSGSDEGCESIFGYCSAKRVFRNETKWLPGQPDNAGGKENHVAVHMWREKRQVLLADYDGNSKKFRYICEKRRNPQTKSGKQAIIDECAVIYSVTEVEIDLLRNATNLDLRMKCFVQCVGDAVGLLVGGKFVESEVFAILETLALSNMDELIKNMAIVDECNNKTYGMDECDKAYQLAKCARDKAPEVFDQIIKDLDNQIPKDSDQMISKAYGCANYGVDPLCTINVAEKNKTDAINPVASTCSFNGDGRYWTCRCNDTKNYLIFYTGGRAYNNFGAATFCCERGMRLLSAQNFIKASSCMKPAAMPTISTPCSTLSLLT